MFLVEQEATPCRTAAVAACETKLDVAQSAAIPVVGEFQIRKRDVLDFTVDLSAWLAANGGAQLTGAAWAIPASSPKTPVLSGQAFSADGKALVVVTPNAADVAGDIYQLDVTLTVGATTAAPIIAARTLVRRIQITVVNG